MDFSQLNLKFTFLLPFAIVYISSVTCQSPDDYTINAVGFLTSGETQFTREGDDTSIRVLDVIHQLQPANILQVNVKKTSTKFTRDEMGNNTQCDLQLALVVAGLSRFKGWALRMLDSSSKIPSGILVGNWKDFGVYDECTSVAAQEGPELIRGRHCMYALSVQIPNIPIPLSPTLSICVPDACTAEDVALMLQTVINKTSNYLPFPVGAPSVVCSTVDPPPFEAGEIVTIVILALFVGFLVGCTTCDIVLRLTRPVPPGGILTKFCRFSLYFNIERIFDTTAPRGNIPVIQGIRFFSLCWVILGHEHILPNTQTAINLADGLSWITSWGAVYILIAPFAVDTFFVLSGFLTSYLFFQETARGRQFSPFMYYLHRYIRLTPAFAAMIVLSIYILPRMGSGALWESTMNSEKEVCKSNWWSMLLYVHNYVGDRMGCLDHTWYLAVDMQLFWMSPLILWPLARRSRIGLRILTVFLVASVIIPAVIVGVNKYPSVIVANLSDVTKIEEMMRKYYITTYTRAGPWLLGIYLGYRLNKSKDDFGPKVMMFGWMMTLLAFIFSFFTYRIFQGADYVWGAPWEIFYAGFSRHIWAFAICWLIYSAVLGYGGVISRFLSLPMFLPLGRISYSVYLTHKVIQDMRTASARVPTYFSELGIVYSTFAEIIASVVTGLALSLVFESPFLVIEKMIFGEGSRAQRKGSREELIEPETIDDVSCSYDGSQTQLESEISGESRVLKAE